MLTKINELYLFFACMIIGLMAIANFGCKKFVQISPPSNKLVSASVFDNVNAATAAQLGIYSGMTMNQESYAMARDRGLQSDELSGVYSQILQMTELYTNGLDAINAMPQPWTDAYNYIYQANQIIENMSGNSAFGKIVENQLVGESKFIRAFWMFYLTNCYGDIPLVVSTSYNINATIARSKQSDVYKQIVSDLQDAQSLMSDKFVDGTDTAVTTERVRPNKWAATALLARVYLYLNDYADAENQASLVINQNGLFNLDQNLQDVFIHNSSEAIWQLPAPIPFQGIDTYDGNGFILLGAPSSQSLSNAFTISNQLLNSFEDGDKRRQLWVDSITGMAPAATYYFPYKYRVYTEPAPSDTTEYTMILRLAEQYLIRAEARAQLGADLIGAAADLDSIRMRAGLSIYNGQMNKNDLLTAILHERQVELFTEWGQRWFDLIRINKIDAVMDTVTPLKNGVWNSYDRLLPIPQSELLLDINLKQNPGYN